MSLVQTKHARRFGSGFTLIELLVVIAIIGLLASVVFASLNMARAKARDTRRISDFRSFHIALEMYFNTYGQYPVSPNFCDAPGCSSQDHNRSFEAVANTLISEGFLGGVPKDPSRLYMLHDYGPNDPAGQIIVTTLETGEPTLTGLPNTCRPFAGNWCPNDMPTLAYCICHPY